ncbi:MAG: GntR family transcriptional regulator [Bacillota bacterium]
MAAQGASGLLDSLTLRRRTGVPLYVQIREAIRARIAGGELPDGALLPPEHVLAERLGTSRMTVRAALADLERDGLIRRAQGVGTVVRVSRFAHQLRLLTSFTEDIRARGMVPSSRVLAAGLVPADGSVAEALGVRPGSPVVHLCRLRLADGEPVALHDTYLPPGLVDPNQVGPATSLYELLHRAGVALDAAEESLEAVPASEDDARLLGVEAGAPLLLVVRTTCDRAGRAVEHVLARYKADVYRYTVRLQRFQQGG